MVVPVPDEGQDVHPVLDREQRQPPRGLLIRDDDLLVTADRPVRQPHVPARVHHVDPDTLFVGSAVPEPGEPVIGRPVPSEAADHEIGGKLSWRRVLGFDQHTGDPRTCRVNGQAHRRTALDDSHIRQIAHPIAHPPLQERTTGLEQRIPVVGSTQGVPGDRHPHLGQRAAVHRAVGEQFLGDAGEQFLEDPLTPRQQRVHMPTLRDTAPVSPDRQIVALDERDPGETVAEHACRQQARHTRAEHHGVFAFGHPHPPTSSPSDRSAAAPRSPPGTEIFQ